MCEWTCLQFLFTFQVAIELHEISETSLICWTFVNASSLLQIDIDHWESDGANLLLS